MSTIFVTGAAGFIGFHFCKKLCHSYNGDFRVVGIDNINDYYDSSLKEARIDQLSEFPDFTFVKQDISDRKAMQLLFDLHKPHIVVNLAAQAGVRYSIDNPYAYTQSNIQGFLNILEGCRYNEVSHLVFASSSSVYGLNTKMPFSESDNVDHPISLYAATKKSNELMAHTYSHLYGIPCTGLRFFTVYGEWGRPDMAYFKFVKSVYENKPIDVYNNGDMERDFTYIDDIIDGIIGVMNKKPVSENKAPYALYNIGNNKPEKLMDMISLIEKETGKTAIKNMMPMQPGDVRSTWANIDSLNQLTGFEPKTSLAEGIARFVRWYKEYYDL